MSLIKPRGSMGMARNPAQSCDIRFLVICQPRGALRTRQVRLSNLAVGTLWTAGARNIVGASDTMPAIHVTPCTPRPRVITNRASRDHTEAPIGDLIQFRHMTNRSSPGPKYSLTSSSSSKPRLL